jgi:lysozyme
MASCTGTTTPGIDVSKIQVSTDWSQVASSGRTFVFIKYSEAIEYTNASFESDWVAAHSAGILRGAYHYFHPEVDAVAQANFFLQHVIKFGAGELPPVIDVETGTDMHQIGAGVSAWIDTVTAATGKRPLVYCSSGFWRVPASYGIEAKADLWVAQYPATQPPPSGPWCPSVTGAWTIWTFWQHWDKGQVPGVHGYCDVDVFNGSLDELRAYASQGAVAIVSAPVQVFRTIEARIAGLPMYVRWGSVAGMAVLLALLGYALTED